MQTKKRKPFYNRKFLDLESSIDLYLHVDLFLIFQFSVLYLIAPTDAFFAISDDIYEWPKSKSNVGRQSFVVCALSRLGYVCPWLWLWKCLLQILPFESVWYVIPGRLTADNHRLTTIGPHRLFSFNMTGNVKNLTFSFLLLHRVVDCLIFYVF